MKKVKVLQYLVYITFCLFIMQDAMKGFYEGFVDGYSEVNYVSQHGNPQHGPQITAVLNSDFLKPKIDSSLKISPDYNFQNVTINTDIRMSDKADITPWWLYGLDVIAVFSTATVLILIAVTINRIIKKIADGSMFDDLCIQLIRKTASLLIVYTLLHYVYQRVSYIKDSRLLPPPLQMINASAFNYQLLICAILIFIIAEAFKQGNKLKQEQDLTI